MRHRIDSLLQPFALFAMTSVALITADSARAASAQEKLRLNAKSKVRIVLPQSAVLPEQTAARELKDYLTRITGGSFDITTETDRGSVKPSAPAIYVGATQFAARAGLQANSLQSEEWRIRSQGNDLILLGGGTRGTLYAAYHLLEDQAGVHWWNPWEESVPKLKSLNLSRLDRRGKPAFAYRDIYMLYGNDNGRFAARSRLNREGDAGFYQAQRSKFDFAAEYGGTYDYGPPYHVHTLFMYMPPEKYYAAHPDWYIVNGVGPATSQNAQLAFSNAEMRKEFLRLLRENIRTARAAAKSRNLPPPDVFSVSQEDNIVGFATPADAALLKANDGAESVILLDFINYLADGIKDEFPTVYIDTLAYFSGQKPPKTIRPRDNVIVRLTDTTSNLILPITHERNRVYHDSFVSWGKIAKNLRASDYAITFNYPGLPTPTIHTYPTDFRFWLANNAKGIFTELEYPIITDMRDLKVWLYAKMAEDPHQNFPALVRRFTDGFYGAAGPAIREYLVALEKAAMVPVAHVDGTKPTIADISWFATPARHSYLSLDFIHRANAILDRGAAKVANDPILSRRMRHARMSLDRATTLMYGKLVRQWRKAGNTPESLPLDRAAIAARYLQSWNEQIDARLPADQQATEREAAAAEVKKLTSLPIDVTPPARFRDIPRFNVIMLGTETMRRFQDMAKVVPDPSLESGTTARYEIPDDELERYKLPMPWGVHDTVVLKDILTAHLKPEDVPGSGYHWYKVGTTKLTGNDYFYFFWSWIIQIDLDNAYEEASGAKFEVWVNMKFEGPAFPHGKPDEKNAISVERLVLVRK